MQHRDEQTAARLVTGAACVKLASRQLPRRPGASPEPANASTDHHETKIISESAASARSPSPRAKRPVRTCWTTFSTAGVATGAETKPGFIIGLSAHGRRAEGRAACARMGTAALTALESPATVAILPPVPKFGCVRRLQGHRMRLAPRGPKSCDRFVFRPTCAKARRFGGQSRRPRSRQSRLLAALEFLASQSDDARRGGVGATVQPAPGALHRPAPIPRRPSVQQSLCALRVLLIVRHPRRTLRGGATVRAMSAATVGSGGTSQQPLP